MRDTTTTRRRVRLGRAGEDYACDILEHAGLSILERNWHDARRGEIDIIAQDGERLVIVEVRTRVGTLHGSALESVTDQKYRQLRFLAGRWKDTHHHSGRLRIDVIALTISPHYRHILNTQLLDDEASDLSSCDPHVQWIRGIA